MALRGRSVLAVALVTAFARRSSAQSGGDLFSRLNLDKLQLESLGASAGRILPSQVEPTTIYALGADYGEIAPAWRVVFGASYWQSRFRDDVIQTLVDSLNHRLTPGTTGTVEPSRITLYDVALSVEGRYVPLRSADIKPFVGVGLAAHAIDAQGKLISGTLVERSLDAISVGLFVDVGLSAKILQHFGVELMGRGDLLSSFRSTQVRAGATYYFGHIRGMQPPPPPTGAQGPP